MTIAAGIDVETTGFSRRKGAEVIDIAAVLMEIPTTRIIARHSTLVKPTDWDCNFATRHKEALAVNKIDPADLIGAPDWRTQVVPRFRKIASQVRVFVMHNKGFDMRWCVDFMPDHPEIVDTMEVHRYIFGKAPNLAELAEHYGIEAPTHRALEDAECCLMAAWKGGFLERYATKA